MHYKKFDSCVIFVVSCVIFTHFCFNGNATPFNATSTIFLSKVTCIFSLFYSRGSIESINKQYSFYTYVILVGEVIKR